MRPSLVAFGLGSNMGPSRFLLSSSIASLADLLAEARVASIYRTEPVSDFVQPHYLNTVVIGRTDLPPEALLAIAKRLEQLAGRKAGPRDSPRPLDIDLLLYGQLVCDHAELTLPHPRLRERAFVLAPLSEIDPEWRLPPDGMTVIEALADLGDVSGVERL